MRKIPGVGAGGRAKDQPASRDDTGPRSLASLGMTRKRDGKRKNHSEHRRSIRPTLFTHLFWSLEVQREALLILPVGSLGLGGPLGQLVVEAGDLHHPGLSTRGEHRVGVSARLTGAFSQVRGVSFWNHPPPLQFR